MAVRGRIAELPKLTKEEKKKIFDLYYNKGVKQQEIKNQLSLPSVSVVAEVLRRDMVERIEEFKKISKEDVNYNTELIKIIKFLKMDRKMDYSSVAVALQLPRDVIFKTISDETTGLRNTLTESERADRNREMVRLSQEEGLSVTDVGKRVGLTKQMVSRIFTDLGYKPIRGTRKVQIKQANLPEFANFIKEDCNARLKELNDQLRKVKAEYANSRQYTNKVIIELRCLLVQALAEHLTLTNINEFKKQCKVVRTIFSQVQNYENKPSYYSLLEQTVNLINNAERRKEYKEALV